MTETVQKEPGPDQGRGTFRTPNGLYTPEQHAYDLPHEVNPRTDQCRLVWHGSTFLDPTAEERTKVEREYGLELPSREELSEVELSSRVSEKNGVLFLNMPAVSRAASPGTAPSPLGFVLSNAVLVTVRYAPLRSFESVAERVSNDKGRRTGIDVFSELIDEMVDLSADLLEETASDLDAISSAIFSNSIDGSRHATRSNNELRDILTRVGTAEVSAFREFAPPCLACNAS